MLKGSDILKIVKEDILRTLSERKKKVSLESIKAEIRVSYPFLSKAIKDLEEENLIWVEKKIVRLTKNGRDEAKDILRKHLVLEKYFKETRGKRKAHEMAHILEHYISMEVIDNIKKLSTLKKESVSLIEFEQKEGLVANILLGIGLFERLVSMGICPGEKIRITNKIPNGVIIETKNKKFALDKIIAKGIKMLEYEKS